MWKWTRHSQHVAQFIGAATIIIGMVLSWFGPNGVILLLATSVLLLVLVIRDIRNLRDSIPAANVLTSVATNRPLFTALRQIADACAAAELIQDSLHRDLSLERIEVAAEEVSSAAAGNFEFESTERWRAYYERLLTSSGLHVYRSVAVVRKPSYWQTEAGIKGMQLNHQLSESKRLTIERVVVLTNELWPDRHALPVERIQEWLIEQHHHGISLYLVREFELSGEADLLVDMGIYGSRAVGVQDVDDHGNTRRFTLQFGLEHVQQAEERWQRLLVYAVKYSDFLDRYAKNNCVARSLYLDTARLGPMSPTALRLHTEFVRLAAEEPCSLYCEDFLKHGIDAVPDLQDRLFAGDECRYDERSPSTVNSMMGAVMAFIRFCHVRSLVPIVPPVEKLDVDEVMKGRPISAEEFKLMLDATESVVGPSAAESWKFSLQVLWGSAFRVGDLMDFSWDDPRHIHPVWGRADGQHPTIAVPSSQKNGKVQEIPMLPELIELLNSVPKANRKGWVVSPQAIEFEFCGTPDSFRPCDADLQKLFGRYTKSAISRACGVSEATVRKWQKRFPDVQLAGGSKSEVLAETVRELISRSERGPGDTCQNDTGRLTKERVSRVIAKIGRAAGVVVQMEDPRLNKREKHASAHDIRRGVAQRLINHGVSAETLKVIMRHKDFATTERHYGAVRSAQSAATEIAAKIESPADTSALVGGTEKAPQLNAAELGVLKSLLSKL